MQEKIKAIKEYLKYFPQDRFAKNNLMLCEYADELGLKLNGSDYPRIDYNYCLINPQIKVGKKYSLTNSKTNYKENGKDTLVIWNESSGRLAFVDSQLPACEYWFTIENEWKEFMNVLKSYAPLDYDDINNVYIYNVENGKRLINDYDSILQDFQRKIDLKIKEIEIKNKRKQLEKLQKELLDYES